ncbi:MAG: sensor histidine kinase [Acidimicrobiales bacterium]
MPEWKRRRWAGNTSSQSHLSRDSPGHDPEPGSRRTSRPFERRWGRLGSGTRVLLVHGMALGIVLGAVTFEVVHGFSVHYTHTIVSDLSEEGSEYAHAAAERPVGQAMDAFSRSYLQTHVLARGHFVLIGLTGQPALASSGARLLASSKTVAAWLSHPPIHSQLRSVHAGSTTYLVLASPIRTSGGVTIGVLVAAADLAHLQAERNQVLLLAGVEAAIALAVALLSSFLVLRRVLSTVGAVTRAAVDASVGDLNARFGAHRADDEVGRLTAAFDAMLERISAGLEAQRQLLADVSHQLRTPLTVARGHLEVLERNPDPERIDVAETTATVIGELARMATLVDRLLLLGRSFSPDFIDAGPVAVRVFMAELFESASVLAERRWILSELPDIVVMIDGAKLRGALLNLVDNAVKATGADDTIELRVRYEGDVVFSVSDTGTGIALDAQQEVFDRFKRAGSADQRGSGLGLAIVKAVTEAHGGRVHLDSTEGGGTTVDVVLPPSCVWWGLSDDEEDER